MKNTIASLLQTRMDKCTTEQFWAVATLMALYSFLITHVPDITVAVPRFLLFPAIIAVTAYGIWFVYQRHRAYYRNRIALASLLRDEKDAPDWLKQPPDLRSLNSLSGVSFYIGCLVVGSFACFITYWSSFPASVRAVPQSSSLEIKFGTKEIKQPVFESSEVTVKIQDPTNIEVNVKPKPLKGSVPAIGQ